MMASIQNVAVVLVWMGLTGVVIVCSVPLWKVSSFDWNTATVETFLEGLWLTCSKQPTGQMQCELYDSMLALPYDLKAARVLVVLSILVTFLGILLNLAGRNCFVDQATRLKVLLLAGASVVIGGVLCLVPVSCSAHEVIQISNDPNVPDAQKRKLGEALFLGWVSAGFLFVGGGIIISQVWSQDQVQVRDQYAYYYAAPRAQSAARGIADTGV